MTKTTQHTPGPWFTANYKPDSQHRTQELIYEDVFSDAEHGNRICRVFLADQNGCEQLANARLISAAPELLATLKKQAEGFNSITDNAREWTSHQLQRHAQDLRLLADAAIAKAEGR